MIHNLNGHPEKPEDKKLTPEQERELDRAYEEEVLKEDRDKEAYYQHRDQEDLKVLDGLRMPVEAALDIIRRRHDREGKPAYLTKLTTPPEYTGEPRVAERQLQAVRDRFAADPWPSMESKVAEAWAKRKPGELWCDIGKRFKMSGNEAMVLYEAFQARLLTGGVK